MILAACARMGAPPGGPEDKVPPAVEAVEPGPDSTGAALDCRPLIVFSEKVRRQTAEALIRVSPPAGRLFFDWDGRKVEIWPAEGLRPEMTYRLSVAAGLEDLHRVRSDRKFESWFSTGSALAPGRISGSLTVNDSAAALALLEARSLKDSLLVFDTEADSSGRYTFPYLPAGGYRLSAWRDASRNRRFDFTREEGADSVVRVALDGLTVDFTLLLADTTAPRLRSVETPDSITVALVFDDRLDSLRGIARAQFEVRTPDSTGRLLALDSVKADSLDASRVLIRLAEPLDPSGRYHVFAAGVVNRSGLAAPGEGRSFSFRREGGPAGRGRQR